MGDEPPTGAAAGGADEPTAPSPREPAARRGPPTPAPLRASVAPEDLSGDRPLRGCRTLDVAGAARPALGGHALLARIGRGGMGVVYHGVNPRLGTEVAVKILPWSMQDQNPGLVDRFLREARLAAQLTSDHLVRVIDVDFDEASGNHFLVMEYVHGRSAGALIGEARDAGRQGLDEADALAVCEAAARGLAAAHAAGIVHRDVKPDNVLVPFDPAGAPLFARAKLADLGLARPEASGLTLTGGQLAMGTPGFAAPEQVRDAKSARRPADVFGLGATLYALLSGQPPFTGSTPMEALLGTMRERARPLREVRSDVSAAVAHLVERCLEREPGKRPQDADAFLAALAAARRGEVPGAVAPAGAPRPDEPAAGEELVGQVVGDCRLLARLGGGRYGSVYRATDEVLDRTVAVRVMASRLVTSPQFPHVFVREMVATAKLSHPNIAAIHKVGQDEARGLHYFVREHAEGRTLHETIAASGALPVDAAVSLALQACDALSHAHEHGIVHRNLKPGKMVVDAAGRLKIVDFALLKVVATGGGAATIVGNPYFMSPEHFDGKELDGRADIYSLGVTLYYLLSAQRPYGGDSPAQVRDALLHKAPRPLSEAAPHVPAELCRIVHRMFARDPAERYATAAEAAEELRRFGRRGEGEAPVPRAPAPAAEPGHATGGADDLVGQLVGGCRLHEKLGEGDLGRVYRATDDVMRRTVAVRVMNPELSEEYVKAFVYTAVTTGGLSHPNIVAVHRVGRDMERALNYVVMEYVRGRTLERIVEAEGPLEVDRALPLALQACLALTAAHDRGVVHRDIKPANLFLDAAGTVKVSDFAVLKSMPAGKGTVKVMGTPQFMSPELFEGKTPDARSDVYSLGTTIYHLLSGTHPFEGENTVQVIYAVLTGKPKPLSTAAPHVPDDLCRLVHRMMERRPEDRHATAADVADELRRIAGARGTRP